ncbi:MAG: transglycosylase domain-containing protein [Lachnospiraceae bacterium]
MSGKSTENIKHRAGRILRINLILIIFFFAVCMYLQYGDTLKEIRSLNSQAKLLVSISTAADFASIQTSEIYDVNGSLISTLKSEKDIYYLTYEKIPWSARTAMVCVEDKNFYSHNGIDFKAVLRAALAMLRNGKVTEGASTITQQLARNIFLTQDQTWERKAEELFIALALEEKYTKEQILEFYLNNIYFGHGFYGIQAASKGYFQKEARELSLSEVAFLCAIPNNPTIYDPVANKENTLIRRDKFLRNMYEEQMISLDAYQEGIEESIHLNMAATIRYNYVETYAYYSAIRVLMQMEGFQMRNEFASDEEKQTYNTLYTQEYAKCQRMLFTGGYRIYTSLSLPIQKELQNSVDTSLKLFTETNEEGVYELQASAVCIDNITGFVSAIVGGREQNYDGYTLNRAYQSFRQPGSAIKPLIVYLPALERGYTADTMVIDEISVDGAKNADEVYEGEITLRSAVEESKNTIAWNLFRELTPQIGLSYLKEMNFAKITESDYVLPASLGGMTYGVSALEMASAYATIENDGVYRSPTCIIRITDAAGDVLYEPKPETKIIYGSDDAREMTDILKGVLTNGTAKGLAPLDMIAAGKTGTTNQNQDGWFAGYTRYYTTCVWVGYDIPKELPGLKGSSYPGEIWKDFMEKLHQDKADAGFLPYVGKESSTATSPGSEN